MATFTETKRKWLSTQKGAETHNVIWIKPPDKPSERILVRVVEVTADICFVKAKGEERRLKARFEDLQEPLPSEIAENTPKSPSAPPTRQEEPRQPADEQPAPVQQPTIPISPAKIVIPLTREGYDARAIFTAGEYEQCYLVDVYRLKVWVSGVIGFRPLTRGKQYERGYRFTSPGFAYRSYKAVAKPTHKYHGSIDMAGLRILTVPETEAVMDGLAIIEKSGDTTSNVVKVQAIKTKPGFESDMLATKRLVEDAYHEMLVERQALEQVIEARDRAKATVDRLQLELDKENALVEAGSTRLADRIKKWEDALELSKETLVKGLNITNSKPVEKAMCSCGHPLDIHTGSGYCEGDGCSCLEVRPV
jgi:hypothetical protein